MRHSRVSNNANKRRGASCVFLLQLLSGLVGQLNSVAAVPCPAGCTKYGTCNLELGRCDCLRNMTGPACDEPVPALARACKHYGFFSVEECVAETPLRCLNACNGRGKCYGGWCHCQEGEPPLPAASCCPWLCGACARARGGVLAGSPP